MFDPSASERYGVSPRDAAAKIRTGIICNPKSHRNRSSVEATKPFLSGTVLAVTPRTQAELAEVLTDFARHGIELLVIDGGDGTIRDVMTAAARVWTGAAPARRDRAVGQDQRARARSRHSRRLDARPGADRGARTATSRSRSPIEVVRKDTGARLRGFLFGAGAFVDATALAQRTHRAGAFNGVAVGLALCWAILQTLFGGANSAWRAGNRMRIRFESRGDEGVHAAGANTDTDRARYILLASTLKRMPIGHAAVRRAARRAEDAAGRCAAALAGRRDAADRRRIAGRVARSRGLSPDRFADASTCRWTRASSSTAKSIPAAT